LKDIIPTLKIKKWTKSTPTILHLCAA